MDLTVLGCAGSHPGPGRLCSGYLLRSGDTSMMLDAGNGAIANLQRMMAIRDLDAFVISHRHVDHCIDLVGSFYALRFDPAFAGRIPLYGAAEVHATLTGLMSADSSMAFDEIFAHTQVGDGDEADIGPFHLRFANSIHATPAVSTRVELGGCSLVYSGDSAGGPDLVRIAAGADLLLCESTWTGDAADYPPGIHLTAREAGRIATEAGVGKLVLTHIAGGTDRDLALDEAAGEFAGPIELAEDLAVYHLG